MNYEAIRQEFENLAAVVYVEMRPGVVPGNGSLLSQCLSTLSRREPLAQQIRDLWHDGCEMDRGDAEMMNEWNARAKRLIAVAQRRVV